MSAQPGAKPAEEENMTSPVTIDVDFDQEVLPGLPAWAKRDPQVVEACRNSLSFRADVFRAKTPAMRRLLKVTASKYIPRKERW